MIKSIFLIASLLSIASPTFASIPALSAGAKHCINHIKQKEGLTSKEQIEQLTHQFNIKQQFRHCLAGQKTLITTEEPEDPTPEERYLLCMAACGAAYGLGSPYYYLCMLFCE